MRPIVGITTKQRDVPSSAGVSTHHVLNRAYPDAVAATGGVPVLLSPVPAGEAPAVLGRLDGLVLSGGGDVDPQTYGSEWHESMYGIDPERDRFEVELVCAAAEMRIPTLAICRGMQVLNVALGGTLVRDIPSQVPGAGQHSRTGEHVYERHQRVVLEPGCRVANALGAEVVMVNSIHHQAIDVLGAGLREVGRADDGVVEAVEAEDESWPLWAVQWHPEYLGERHQDALRLFAAFVGAAAAVDVAR